MIDGKVGGWVGYVAVVDNVQYILWVVVFHLQHIRLSNGMKIWTLVPFFNYSHHIIKVDFDMSFSHFLLSSLFPHKLINETVAFTCICTKNC